jgi:hypothetical protein
MMALVQVPLVTEADGSDGQGTWGVSQGPADHAAPKELFDGPSVARAEDEQIGRG